MNKQLKSKSFAPGVYFTRIRLVSSLFYGRRAMCSLNFMIAWLCLSGIFLISKPLFVLLVLTTSELFQFVSNE